MNVVVALHVACLSASPEASIEQQLRTALQLLLDERAARLRSGITLAFKSVDLTLELVSGTTQRSDDPARMPAPLMKTNDTLMWRSVTKMYTAASVMSLIERGLVGLDDAASDHVDPVLHAANHSSMARLFGPTASNVTVRHLLGMRSGLYDFDDDATRRFCNTHPDVDVSPIDDLWFASIGGHKTPKYAAGTQQDYSSTNYELLGLILMRHASVTAWDLLDQHSLAFGPSGSTLARRFKGTRFALHGACLDYTRVHGYEPDDRYGHNMDTAYISCTNGFTCGNVVATAAHVADFVHALYAEAAVVSRASVDAMSTIWEWYGLGTMDLPSYGRTGREYCRLGHFGVTYGFTANAFYSPVLRYALAWGTNVEDPGQTATHGAECAHPAAITISAGSLPGHR